MSVLDEMKRRRDQVALEADKMLRINRKQGEIGQWRKQVEQSIVQLGNTAFGLHGLGATLPPELADVCRQIDGLNAQILQGEREIERIRQESLPEPIPLTGPRCPSCSFVMPEAATFCPNCGSPRPKPQPTQVCGKCGNALPPDARFCAICGQPTAAPQPETVLASPIDLPTSIICAGCQAEISAQAAFCPLCGTPVTPLTS